MNRSIISLVRSIYLALCVLTLLFVCIKPDLAVFLLVFLALISVLLIVSEILFSRLSEGKATAQSKERILKLMNVINAYVAIWTEDKSQLIANDKLKEELGSLVNLQPRDLIDILFPQSFMTQTKTEMMLSSTRELPLKIEDRVVYVAWTSSVLYVVDDVRYILSVGFDVTENKEIRQKLNITNNLLSASERRYSLAMGLSEIGIILNEHCDNTFHISKELQNMLGLADDTILIDDFMKLIHRDERMPFETYLKAAQSNNIEDLQINNIDMRILSADGHYRWYSFRYKNVQAGQFGMPIIGGAIIDISKEKDKDMLIEKMAYLDEVTGIYNRNKLMINGQEMYQCCKILELSYWVIDFDIDRFHIINDTCGYSNGNQVLKDFASILYKQKRKSGFAARIGGDNFVLIVQDYGDAQYPKLLIQEIQNEISYIGNEHMYNQSLSFSAGYSKMPDDGPDFSTVFERAEFALSTCEKRRSVVRYDSSVHDSIISVTAIEKALADAIEAKELVLYYQPKISLKTKKIMGVEALIRWKKPNGEIVSPEQFVPIAENSHLITKIGEYVMHEACRQNKFWQNMGFPPIVMSINLTSEDFYQKNVKEYLADILARTGLGPEWLEVELTESLAMKDIDFAVQQMQELRDMGLKLAMDDFGTGYSSLSYIQKMPLSLLKLDRSFIVLIENDIVAREIVSAVIKIAKSKKIETIAEGTETPRQIEILEKFGCDYAQGFLFGRPMSADELTEYLRKSMMYQNMEADMIHSKD